MLISRTSTMLNGTVFSNKCNVKITIKNELDEKFSKKINCLVDIKNKNLSLTNVKYKIRKKRGYVKITFKSTWFFGLNLYTCVQIDILKRCVAKKLKVDYDYIKKYNLIL